MILVGIKVNAQTNAKSLKHGTMKINAGIITDKMEETKAFYTETLGFNVTFENEFYLLLGEGDQPAVLSFLLPNHPTQQPLFQPAFQQQGMYLTIEVDDVDALYTKVVEAGFTATTQPIDLGLHKTTYIRGPDQEIIELLEDKVTPELAERLKLKAQKSASNTVD